MDPMAMTGQDWQPPECKGYTKWSRMIGKTITENNERKIYGKKGDQRRKR